jgi:hypothetical protein
MPTYRSILLAAIVTCTLGACASNTASRIGTAATTPLSDLNIARTDIPAVLSRAKQQPYLIPAQQNCVAINLEIKELDVALGPDLDTPVADKRNSLMQKASSAAQDHAVGALQRTAQDLVPFRGWVRKLSGAERHSREVTACVAAGTARRAFLKGMAVAHSCGVQAAALEVTQR